MCVDLNQYIIKQFVTITYMLIVNRTFISNLFKGSKLLKHLLYQ